MRFKEKLQWFVANQFNIVIGNPSHKFLTENFSNQPVWIVADLKNIRKTLYKDLEDIFEGFYKYRRIFKRNFPKPGEIKEFEIDCLKFKISFYSQNLN